MTDEYMNNQCYYISVVYLFYKGLFYYSVHLIQAGPFWPITHFYLYQFTTIVYV